jgi:UDP-N-acetylmuramyl tripeptide synthase
MKKTINLIRCRIVIIAAKLTIFLLRLAHSGGTTLPGKLAIKLYPGILSELSRKYRIFMITGTNGKTTTSGIIAEVLKENKISYAANKSGANLISGIVTCLISDVRMNMTPRSNTALLEVDEAAFRVSTESIKPAAVIVTNFFRDQLDRYGELYGALKAVRDGIANIPDATLILNADDSLCASLGKNVPNPVIYYGFDEQAISPEQEKDTASNHDAAFCLYCKTKYQYKSRFYGHLGHYICPDCGYSRPEALVRVEKITALSGDFSRVVFNTPSGKFSAQINLPGLYNVYNALAGTAFAETLGFSHEKTVYALSAVESSFGRMESISLEDKTIQVILIKNPVGFSQVINFLLTVENAAVISFLINDRLADGTDVSWLWDVKLEALTDMQDRVSRFFVSGTRADDMAVRLKYAGIYTNGITIENDKGTMLDAALNTLKPGETLFILPTYTAMLDIRKILKKRFKLKYFWQ